jgi:hypothetical protein
VQQLNVSGSFSDGSTHVLSLDSSWTTSGPPGQFALGLHNGSLFLNQFPNGADIFTGSVTWQGETAPFYWKAAGSAQNCVL